MGVESMRGSEGDAMSELMGWIDQARHLEPASGARAGEAQSRDPGEVMARRLASGRRLMTARPPLLGVMAAIEEARRFDVNDPIERDALWRGEAVPDLVAWASPAPAVTPKPPAPAPPKQSVPAAKAARAAAPAPSASPRPAAPRAASGGSGLIADALLDAIAQRALGGAARAEAARLLAEGLALEDQALMREALAVLVTGSVSEGR